ncbi:UBP14 [Mytilus edulis]|uniref:USP5_13 n=1 Tax=Mytilus edulis TaxID=6550 RepID=A0A8S3UQL8_MYTED|nr:UBP14 [Mytilus edulis]
MTRKRGRDNDPAEKEKEDNGKKLVKEEELERTGPVALSLKCTRTIEYIHLFVMRRTLRAKFQQAKVNTGGQVISFSRVFWRLDIKLYTRREKELYGISPSQTDDFGDEKSRTISNDRIDWTIVNFKDDILSTEYLTKSYTSGDVDYQIKSLDYLTEAVLDIKPMYGTICLEPLPKESNILRKLFVDSQGHIRLSDPSVNLLSQPTNVPYITDSVMKKRSAEGLGAASRGATPISSIEKIIL